MTTTTTLQKSSISLVALAAISFALPSFGQDEPPNPDKNLRDVTATFQKLIDDGGGKVHLSSGRHRITRPLVFDLAKLGAVSVTGDGPVTLVMDGPGPALRFIGTHGGTADPGSFKPETWLQRMPLVSGIEILGSHEEADGIELDGCAQPIIDRVAVRGCRHGIHLVNRNRNVIISNCHLYENQGVGLYLDAVNLHQINVNNSHISYNRQGGIVVRNGNVRNLQITGCDLEGNMPGDPTPTTAANILLDVSGTPDDRSHSIAEIAIANCTIQHSSNYSKEKDKSAAPGGANIRLLGKDVWPIDSVAITGNVISDTETNIHIDRATDVTLSGNTFFAPGTDNLHVSNSQRIVVTGNTFNPRQFERPGAIRFTDCADSLITGCTLHKFQSPDGALIFTNCSGMTASSLSITDCVGGIVLKATSDSLIANCRSLRQTGGAAALSIDSASKNIQQNGNQFPPVAKASAGEN
jgi:nitrous oxidase accessory protein NosD